MFLIKQYKGFNRIIYNNFSGFIFIYTPQILYHFHFISNPISTLFFCLVFFHLISEFELDLNHISSPRSQVRALHFCSFAIRLASISVRSRVNENKPKEDHHLHFPIWCHFYFVSHSIPTSFLFGFPFHFDYRHTWGVLEIFTKPSPSNDVSLHFTLEPCPSVTTHIFHGKPQNYCKVSLKVWLAIHCRLKLSNLIDYIANIKPL